MAYFWLIAGRIKFLYMKKIITLTLAAFIFLVSVAQSAGGLDDVISALRNGNATELAKYVDNNIELSLPSKTDNYSRQQAVVILQDFFSNNGVKSFEVKHKGDNGGNQFCIGTLSTRSGTFRTTFFMAEKGGKQFVKEIRFQQM
jgi:hypothetical protein